MKKWCRKHGKLLYAILGILFIANSVFAIIAMTNNDSNFYSLSSEFDVVTSNWILFEGIYENI